MDARSPSNAHNMTQSHSMTYDELIALIDQAAEEEWTELDLSGKELTVLPPEIGRLTQLETLILGKVKEWKWVNDQQVPTLIGNALTTIPDEIVSLANLSALDISGNPLGELPTSIFQLQSLTDLTAVSININLVSNWSNFYQN